jgi:hypothetical protein
MPSAEGNVTGRHQVEKMLFSPGTSRSRSTSAGTESTNLGDASSKSPPIKCAARLNGLPDMEYPTPQLTAALSQRCTIDDSYPSPLVIRNTFLDVNDETPKSFTEFLEERLVKSCPGSGISKPPGLEKPIAPRQLLPEIEYPVPFVIQRNSDGVPDMESPSMVVRNTFLEPAYKELGSLASFVREREIKSCPASCIGAPPGLELASTVAFSTGVEDFTEDMSPLTPYQQPIAVMGEGLGFFSALPPALPPRLDYLQPCHTLPAPLREPQVQMKVPPPPPSTPPKLRISQFLLEDEPTPGTPDLPTVGSIGHRFGTCKPCAFLYTKGCDTGVECKFCHLCEPGEKKRRLKAKTAAFKAAQVAAYSVGVAAAAALRPWN